MSSKGKRTTKGVFACLVLVFVLLATPTLTIYRTAFAQSQPRMINRSLRLGSTAPAEVTDYTMSWRYPVNTNVRSVKFVFCSDPYVLDPCSSTPDGDFSAANLASQSGAVTGFTVGSQSASEIVMTRLASAAGTAQSTYTFDNVVNPSGLHARFFIQIFTYPTADASGPANWLSSVTSAIAEPIVITTVVPPILYFCAGLTVTEWCEDVSGNFIDYGDFSPYVTDYATSQFGASTNAPGGYVVTVNGDTLTAGNKLITPMDTLAPNTPGIGQFGLNLRANTDPAAGADAFGSGIGVVDPDYDTPDMYRYNDGDVVASAVTGTMFNTYTVTYVVNIDPDQPSGVYNTTIAYICTAAF